MGFLPAIGASYSRGSMSAYTLYDQASLASHEAKADLKSRVKFFSQAMMGRAEEDYKVLSEFKNALADHEITFYLQPQCRSDNGQIVGAEALARWVKPDGRMIPPAAFIPTLERYRFVPDLDKYIWEDVCKWVRKILDQGKVLIPVSVNISPVDIFTMDVPAVFEDLISRYQIPREAIKIEITESAYSEGSEKVRSTVQFFRDRGFVVLMDDFGSGFSSLNMLRELNVDIIKLDAFFLRMNRSNERKGMHIIESVINMAKTMEMPVIVEGVETKEQCDYLMGLGIRYIQGYYFYKPMSSLDFEKLISEEGRVDSRGFVFTANEEFRIREFLNDTVYSDSMLNHIIGPAAIDSCRSIAYEVSEMKTYGFTFNQHRSRSILALILAVLLCLSGCSSANEAGRADQAATGTEGADTSHYLRITGTEPDTVDPQCTGDYYNVPLNVFDRLVEVRAEEDGSSSLVPSLAESWEISEDGMVYTFHLHEGVTFSNGSPLTSSDVEYTLIRALTHPDSRAGDIGEFVAGAEDLQNGKTQTLEGFRTLSDLDFTITLSYPYAALLAMLSVPEYSILDQESTAAAGDRFGKDPEVTVGTGSFVFSKWNPGKELILTANPGCWSGAPGCGGIIMQFVMDAEAKRIMFEEGRLDILDLEDLGSDAEYFIRGDVYRDQICYGRRVGLSYIGLNESVKPLNDVRVRKALQLALDRKAILMNVYSGRGTLENGIYPHGLIGFNPELPEIPYDLQKAAALMEEAGYPEGFDLEITVDDISAYYNREIMELAAAMWEKIGVRAAFRTVEESEFWDLRKKGKIACYASRFSVDYNDPDAIIYLFYGTAEGSKSRSLFYGNEEIIDRVSNACSIVNDEERLREYRDLERIIVQEDCAWIPLFSNDHYFIVNKRVKNFHVSWNGWTDTRYRDVVIEE